jgi:phthiodiolone/phenolphthiodiolone dimycocerosates ketoreductase
MAAIEYSVLAEKAGFKILWMPDHFVDINGDMLEPWTILSAVATKTKKIRLASSVTDTQRSHPARTAHAVACLDVISGGRAILGIGAGEAMNILPFGLPWGSPSQRTVRLEEAVQVIRLLWSSSRDNPKNFEGQFYKLNRAYLSQSPKQKPCPPIYVGVFASPKALKIVGRWGDGWYSWINTPETFRERWDVIRQSAEAAGRSVSRIEPCSHLMIALPRTRGEEKRALLSGKVLLLMEKHTLRGFGYSADMPQYQHIMTSREDVAEVMAEAEKIPEEYVYKTMSVGGIREIEQKVEGLVKAGVRHFAVADLLAPKTVRRTMTAFSKIIRTA